MKHRENPSVKVRAEVGVCVPKLRTVSHHLKLEGTKQFVPLRPEEETNPASTLILDF